MQTGASQSGGCTGRKVRLPILLTCNFDNFVTLSRTRLRHPEDGLRNCGLIPGRANIYYRLLSNQTGHTAHPESLFTRTEQLVHVADLSHSSIAAVRNARSYNSTLPYTPTSLWLTKYADNLNFTFILHLYLYCNMHQQFLPLVLLFLCALLLTVVCLLCIALLSCVYFCYLMCIVLLCVYCCLTYFSCRIAGQKPVFGRSCYRPPRHRFFLVSLCL